jgi:hypothetical protein
VPTFNPDDVPGTTPREWVDAINYAIPRLKARKVPELSLNVPTRSEFLERWIKTFLQTHIRRGLSLIDGGLAELKAGRTIITAFCARALLEDAALLWHFNKRVTQLVEQPDDTELEQFVFSKALASKLSHHIEHWGIEYRATNILTAIDRMTEEYPNLRAMYDELSDVPSELEWGSLSLQRLARRRCGRVRRWPTCK